MQEIIDCLQRSHLLKYAPESVISSLAPLVERITVSQGEQLITKGDSGDTMYIVANGSVRVHDKDVILKILGQYELFGEIRALTSDVSTASITAESESILLRIKQEDFFQALQVHPSASKAIIKALVEKERNIVNDVTDRAVRISVYQKELEIGRTIQTSFLPDKLPIIEGWDIDGQLIPAKEVSGDFYDFFRVQTHNCLAVVIGDVCDKGVGAALFMSLFRSLIRFTSLSEDYTGWSDTTATDWSDWGNDDFADEDVQSNLRNSITYANNYVATTHRKSSMFASVLFCLVNIKTGKVFYINAGHEAPALLRKSGVIERLEPTGPVIGLFPDIHYEVGETKMQPGDTLFAFTDGLPEAKNTQEKQFGDDNLVDEVTTLYKNDGNLMDGVFQALSEHTLNTPQFDDMTAISISRK